MSGIPAYDRPFMVGTVIAPVDIARQLTTEFDNLLEGFNSVEKVARGIGAVSIRAVSTIDFHIKARVAIAHKHRGEDVPDYTVLAEQNYVPVGEAEVRGVRTWLDIIDEEATTFSRRFMRNPEATEEDLIDLLGMRYLIISPPIKDSSSSRVHIAQLKDARSILEVVTLNNGVILDENKNQ